MFLIGTFILSFHGTEEEANSGESALKRGSTKALREGVYPTFLVLPRTAPSASYRYTKSRAMLV